MSRDKPGIPRFLMFLWLDLLPIYSMYGIFTNICPNKNLKITQMEVNMPAPWMGMGMGT
jgi:hypothetical protein